ncbi:MAG: helix-turn-helix transcriptional regulator [bacterium]|nr:helix-turn-helix transcriptional regulator [bacterium]
MESYKHLRAKLLKNKEFRDAYDALEPEFALAAAIIERRIKKGLTQAALAKRMKTKQSAIARLESGNYNPTLLFLDKAAKALGARVKISFS